MSAATSPPAAVVGRSSPGFARRLAHVLSAAVLLVAAMTLVAVVVAAANGVRVRVEQTGSMAPQIQPGDLVLVRQTPVGRVRIGDVIGVQTARGEVIVHRVKAIDAAPGSLHVTTQGDANPTSEDWTIPRAESVALVQGVVPAVGKPVDALKGPVAAVLVLIAGLLLAASLLRSIWRRP